MIGLDNHVGFISKEVDGVYFIHSSYIEPVAVVKEKAETAEALVGSNLFVLGHLTENPVAIKSWLLDETILVKK